MGKTSAYDELVAERKLCRQCPELVNPGIVEDGRFDSSEVGPWSRWQGNLDARVMLVGQDWGDVRYFVRNRGLEAARNPTNLALIELMGLLGVRIGSPGDEGRRAVAFFTNAVLCLKSSGLQGKVQNAWFSNCRDFLRRQVSIVSPKVLVCLGERAWREIAAAFQIRPGSFRDAVDDPLGVVLANGTRAFACYHCGRRIQNTHRPLEVQRKDWLRIARFL